MTNKITQPSSLALANNQAFQRFYQNIKHADHLGIHSDLYNEQLHFEVISREFLKYDINFENFIIFGLPKIDALEFEYFHKDFFTKLTHHYGSDSILCNHFFNCELNNKFYTHYEDQKTQIFKIQLKKGKNNIFYPTLIACGGWTLIQYILSEPAFVKILCNAIKDGILIIKRLDIALDSNYDYMAHVHENL